MANLIKIDKVEYDYDTLPDVIKAQLAHVRMVEVEIARLQGQMAIHQTARASYVKLLQDELAKLGLTPAPLDKT